MSRTSKKWLKNLLRWGIAVFGIWYVLSNMSWNDRVLIAGADGYPISVKLAEPAPEDASEFKIVDPDQSIRTLPRDEVLQRIDTATIELENQKWDLVARRDEPGTGAKHFDYLIAPHRNVWQRYWNHHTLPVRAIKPSEIHGPVPSSIPYPRVDRGIGPMLHQADRGLLLAAIFCFPIVFVIVSFRWHQLLKALDIRVTLAQAFVLSMVGSFYNTFMPGSTGGDLLKAYYASRLTTHRTRAVMSVIVDRIIGLLALVILGGFMASVGFFTIDPRDPARHKCGQIALGSGLIIFGSAVAMLIFYQPTLRRITGLDWIIRKLPMQRQVQKAIETMEIYRTRPMLVLGTILITLPVHSIVVISATFAGMAFKLPLHPLYYWVVVPVVVLAGSIPISPQGAGVMEFFAILLTKRQGCTVSQAFALTMSIRIVQIVWNLTGGLFVLRGGFHAPTDTEQHTMDVDLPEASASEQEIHRRDAEFAEKK